MDAAGIIVVVIAGILFIFFIDKLIRDSKEAQQKTQQAASFRMAMQERAMQEKQARETFAIETRSLMHKYGVNISDDDIVRLSNRCEHANSKEAMAYIFFSFIPDNIPTLKSISAHAPYFAENLLNLCPNIELRDYIREQFSDRISVITESELHEIYNTQKQMQVQDQAQLFRFNFELFAFAILFHEVDEVSIFLFPKSELEQYKNILLKFGEENGYSLNTPSLLNETIQHFKDFFKKYGVDTTPEEIAHIMVQYAMAAEDGVPDSIVYDIIPDEIPSPEKFIKETGYQINKLLSLCPDETLKLSLHFNWALDAKEITPASVCTFYSAQKEAYQDDTSFRYDYEWGASLFLLTYCDTLFETADPAEEKVLSKFRDDMLKQVRG